MTKVLRCKHRHTIEEHPSCFMKGMINFKDDKEFTKKTGKNWYEYPGYKIGYFDIETDGLTADFGTMLSWCLKDKSGDVFYDIITKEELFDGTEDRRLVHDLITKLKEYSIIVTYYGTGMDIPFARSKALHYGLEFPDYGDIYHFDLYYAVRDKLRLSRNSLANACDYLRIEGKTPLDKEIWRKAKYGDPIALNEVLEHNKGDVIILEELHDRLEFARKWTKRSL